MEFLFAGEPLQMNLSPGPGRAFLTLPLVIHEKLHLWAWLVPICLWVASLTFFSVDDSLF